MSGDALGYVVRHSPFKGATFTVHLCIADSMSDLHGNRFWMSTATLAAKARVSRKSASEAIAELVNDGFLSVLNPPLRDDGKPTGRPGQYQFEYPDAPLVFETRWSLRGVTTGGTPTEGRVTTGGAGVTSGDTGRNPGSHNTENTKKNHWAATPKKKGQTPEAESMERTAAAQRAQQERNNERIFGGHVPTDEPADAKAWIEKIRAERAQVRAK
jgi:hypothetical protein